MSYTPATIRPYQPSDGPGLRQLLRHTWADDETAMRFYRYGESSPGDGGRYMQTFVAEADGRPVGFGSLWTSPFHPQTFYCGVNVHPAWPGRGVGRALLAELMRVKPDDRPLQASTWESRPRSLRFLAAAGFTLVRRTYNPRLPAAAVDQEAYGPVQAACAQRGYHIVSLAELAHAPANRSQIAALCAEIYTATHQVNPPGSFSIAQWQEMIFGQPLLPAGSFVALYGGEFAAVALLHPADEPGAMELGWRGVGHGHQTDTPELMLTLTLAQVRWASAHGCNNLLAEVDSTDPSSQVLLDALPFQPAPAWATYRRS